jgi:DNA polymerase-1
MRIALDPGPRDGPVRIRRLADDGTPLAAVETLPGLGSVADLEREHAPRWVLARPRTYRRLLTAGVRVARAHDVELVEGLLVGAAGRSGEPHGLAAAAARLAGRVPEPDPPPDDDGPPVLFEPGPARDELADLVAVHGAQQRSLTRAPLSGGLRLLAAAESAGALVAGEMHLHGLPWSARHHDALLTELLGPRPVLGGRPPHLAALAADVEKAFGRPVNPDSPADVLRAFGRAGHELTTTRAWELRHVDHPAVAPLLAYKELSRLHTAHGWAWLRTWVREGRFHPEYVVGGVVTGRWATRGGGALQIPRAVRAAVRADPGWRLVVADAAQLEPRVLAALSGDHALAPGDEDLYAALAAREFGDDRSKAKLALLSAMYGASGGSAGELLVRLRRRFPQAMAFVDGAARDGERFTRNFVVQATAAEWALVLLAELRLLLRDTAAELVFFQHDEVLLHCPADLAPAVVDAVAAAADTARRRLFGDTPVRFPLQARTVASYDER